MLITTRTIGLDVGGLGAGGVAYGGDTPPLLGGASEARASQ